MNDDIVAEFNHIAVERCSATGASLPVRQSLGDERGVHLAKQRAHGQAFRGCDVVSAHTLAPLTMRREAITPAVRVVSRG